jgi:hypothetical protein
VYPYRFFDTRALSASASARHAPRHILPDFVMLICATVSSGWHVHLLTSELSVIRHSSKKKKSQEFQVTTQLLQVQYCIC